jgi:hypothetical protein
MKFPKPDFDPSTVVVEWRLLITIFWRGIMRKTEALIQVFLGKLLRYVRQDLKY